MIPQDVYAGLDVSQETTSICVVNSTGAVVWRGSCATDPASIASTLHRHAPKEPKVIRGGAAMP